MTDSIGQKIIDGIISGGLFHAECPDSPNSGVLVIWSSGAAEQIEAIVQTAMSNEQA